MNPYQRAQAAIAELKLAVLELLTAHSGTEGMTNAEIGKALGIYMGHIEHEGHISRTILTLLEREGLVEQNKLTKRWKAL